MKTIVGILLLLLSNLCWSQNDDAIKDSPDFKLENVSLSLSINSSEDLESLDMESLISVFEEVSPNEDISVELNCKGKPMSNGELSSFSMKVKGNTNQRDQFTKLVKKLKKTAQTFYKIQ